MKRNRRRTSAAIRSVVEQLESRMFLAAAGPDAYGYLADPTTFEDIDLDFDTPGVEQFADFGNNTFNFYGHTLTPALNSNGLLTFGQFTQADVSVPSNLSSRPFMRVIAPLWSGYRGTHTGAVFMKFENTGGPDARPDRAIIEWQYVRRNVGETTVSLEFQAILELNTGNRPGDIIFQYRNLDSINEDSTVGIKDVGEKTNRLLLGSPGGDFIGDLVGEGKAILIHNESTGQPIARTGKTKTQPEGSDTVAIQVSALDSIDPNQASKDLGYAWDFDLDGFYGETGADATNGNERGATATFIDSTPGSGRSGPRPYRIAVRVTDASGFSSFGDGYVAVSNVAPSAVTVTSGPNTATPGVPVSFTFSATDPGDDLRGFEIDWGDENIDFAQVADLGDTSASIQHTYYTPGTHTITVKSQDGDFAYGPAITRTITVGALPTTPTLSSGGVIMVGGTGGNDTIEVDLEFDNTRVTRNGVETFFPSVDVKGIAIDGAGGNDSLISGPNVRTTVHGGSGDDTIHTDGEVFISTLYGGDGNDNITDDLSAVVRDLVGNNTIHIGGGNIRTGPGNDVITTDDGGTIASGDGNDSITAGGSNRIDCGNGADTVMTGDFSDTIIAGGSPDSSAFIDAGGAPDEVIANFATTINGGEGVDIIRVGSAVQVNGGDGIDTIFADRVSGAIDAGAGNDTVHAASDASHPVVVFGGDGNDTIFTGGGRDSLFGGAGRDRLSGGDASDLMSGGGGKDTLYGGTGPDRLYGGAGADRLFGEGSDDRLSGGSGVDTLTGGAGRDTNVDDDPADILVDGLV